MKRAVVALIAIVAAGCGGSLPVATQLDGSGPRDEAAKIAQNLYVVDVGSLSVKILSNGKYAEVGTIKKGLSTPDGDFLSKDGALFVANYGGKTITEYAPGADKPAFTYSEGMYAPVNVTVDAHGNVFEADYHGYVTEYARHSNVAMHRCTPNGGVEGVAVDEHDNVFVSYNPRFGSAKVAEYEGGLDACHAKILKPQFKFTGGIALDAKGNLLVCDQQAGQVNVLKPPYEKISSMLGGNYTGPFHITLSKSNKLAFISDPYLPGVYVVDYQTGKQITVLGSANGLKKPIGAVDSPNAVY